MREIPILYIVVPCYNEEKVLPITAPLFQSEIADLVSKGKIRSESRVLFVDDGSKDNTWKIITDLAENNRVFSGVRQSRNRGHQNAVVAGLSEAREKCDVAISIDCDGQDDVTAMEKMIDAYLGGSDIVCGVRADRSTDSFFKRTTAQGYYKLLAAMGVDVIYNHADYRLTDKKVLDAFFEFGEVNLFLRGMFPLVGFNSTVVTYDRVPRIAGESHYSLRKMLGLAIDGITSLSAKPIRLIFAFGTVITALSLLAGIVGVIAAACGVSFSSTAILSDVIVFFGGAQLLSVGVIGEYVGKIYMEVKHRPRFIISERTEENHEDICSRN